MKTTKDSYTGNLAALASESAVYFGARLDLIRRAIDGMDTGILSDLGVLIFRDTAKTLEWARLEEQSLARRYDWFNAVAAGEIPADHETAQVLNKSLDIYGRDFQSHLEAYAWEAFNYLVTKDGIAVLYPEEFE